MALPSDPLKVARYREVARLRNEWIRERKLAGGRAPRDLAFLSSFLLEVEHTWGTDTKTWLDFDHYTPHDLRQMLDQPKYQSGAIELGGKASGPLGRDRHAAGASSLRGDWITCAICSPPSRTSRVCVQHPAGDAIETKHFVVDARSQNRRDLANCGARRSGRDWASARQPLAAFSYQTLSKSDYDRFFAAYLKSKADWAPKDFGKPNIERFGAESRVWVPSLVECREGRTRIEPSHRRATQDQ